MDENIKRFGRYEVLAEIGRGAMGVVYKARDPKINRIVAVKTISMAGQPPEEEQEYRERFLREAEAAGRISHPGIVTIFDIGEEPETHTPYIVMEFVGGQSLERLLSRKGQKLPLAGALKLTVELAEALTCAHAQGVVHRDLKPANILITDDGSAKIADFGVAKLNLANHTLAGRALGTPAFMSPEQLNGDAVDGRSDLFSLGVILYTVLTGYRPFQGNSALTVSYKVVNRNPLPVTVLDTELPPGVDHIISRAMAKDPAERYQTGMEIVCAIRRLQGGKDPSTVEPTAPDLTESVISTAEAESESVPPSAYSQVYAESTTKPKSLGSPMPLDHGDAAKLIQKLRSTSLAGLLLVVGLFIFALRIVPLVWPKTETFQPLPLTRTTPPSPDATIAATLTKYTAKQAANRAHSATALRAAKPVRSVPKLSSLPDSAPSPSQLSQASVVAPVASAMLGIEVDHKFPQANLSIWVDDQLAYNHSMEATDKKRLILFHHLQGHEIHTLQLIPGKHVLRVQVSVPDVPDQSATAESEFASNSETILHIQFKGGNMVLKLR